MTYPQIVSAYLRRGDHNIVLVDWTDYAYDSYILALVEVRKIARTVATILDGYIAQGLPSEALHIVGHSMGAQMAGFIGKYTNFVVPRITGKLIGIDFVLSIGIRSFN